MSSRREITVKMKCTNPKHGKDGYEWEYKGVGKFYATCPQCYRKVKIPETVVEE